MKRRSAGRDSRSMEKLQQHPEARVPPESTFQNWNSKREAKKGLAISTFFCGANKELIRLTIVSEVWASLMRVMAAGRFLDGFEMPHADFREFDGAQGREF